MNVNARALGRAIAASRMARLAARWRREREGAAMVEYALIGPLLIMTLIGIVEVSMVMFLNIMVESSVRDAARYGLTGLEMEGQSREEYIISIVEQRTLGLLTIDSSNVDVSVYDSFAEIADDEPYTDVNTNGEYDDGEPYVDTNGNGSWDGDPGTPGAGDANEIVMYRVNAEWALFTPFMASLLGQEGLFTISASVAVRNEPWDII